MEGLQRAFILHSRPYSETSLILDVFTEFFGRVALIAKGARAKQSKLKGSLQPFTPLFLTWSGKGEIATLRYAEPISLAIPLASKGLYSAFYLNEILVRVLASKTAYTPLFHHYLAALTELAQEQDPEPTLRRFEFSLLDALGYGIDFLHCAESGAPVNSDMHYLFHQQQGFIASLMQNSAFSFSGNQLKAFARREFSSCDELKAAKRFTRMALTPYLGNKPLKSRELFLLKARKTPK